MSISPSPAATARPDRLRRGSLSARHIAFFVLAAAAPLTCVVGITPLSIGFGAGTGAPLVYLLAGVVLALFAVGYVAMSRHVPEAGAFYAYIARGLGRPIGMGAALVSVTAYTSGVLALSGFAGYAMDGSLHRWFGASPGWFACSALVLLATTAMSIADIAIGARVLGTLMVLEMLLLLVLGVTVLARGGAEGVTATPFSPTTLLSGGIGVSLIFAYASFIGFEQTAVYAEEARDAARSVPRATYLAVAVITVFYVFVSWTLLLAFGVDNVVAVAAGSPADLVAVATGDYLGTAWVDLLSVLIVTSSFAAVLAFHNATARYLFAMGRERLLPARLATVHPGNGSPRLAALIVGAVSIAALGVAAAAGLDPYLQVNAWASAVAAVGMIVLQAVCSLAVVVFFRRTGLGSGPWQAVIAPALGGAGLVATLWLIVENFGLLTGTTSAAAGAAVLGALLLVGAAGAVYGLVARRTAPQRYAAFAADRR